METDVDGVRDGVEMGDRQNYPVHPVSQENTD